MSLAEAEENEWDIEEDNDLLGFVLSTPGIITYGDSFRFFIPKEESKSCDQIGIYFSFFSKDVKELAQKTLIPLDITYHFDYKNEGPADFQYFSSAKVWVRSEIKIIPGSITVMTFERGFPYESIVTEFGEVEKITIKLVSPKEDAETDYKPEDYFDIDYNSWRLDGLIEQLDKLIAMCKASN
tara:strand:- start:451 stop:999 length:549 start_codon:yes stop_codon:yes gene_type:complete